MRKEHDRTPFPRAFPVITMTTLLPQGSASSQPQATDSGSSDDQTRNDMGKRVLSQLERTEKFGRMSSEGQSTPAGEDILQALRSQRMSEYRQAVYIDPLAKPSVQASSDKNLFPLMDKVKEFLEGDGQVMLILGDSGAGKSAFNRHLEYKLWLEYKPGDRIPLFINLPALDRPDKNLITEQLRSLEFSEQQIQDLRQHHRLLLICDGYDETQLTSNLHTTNVLNRPGQQDIKLLITCRTQYLGPDYRDRFVPRVSGGYHLPANDLFHEAVIAPFTKDQIEMYVEKYVPLEPRTWVIKDYMDRLTTIPNLMGLVKNPFLLTLALEALPKVVQGKNDLSRVRVTRVQLYDIFGEHWLGVNKRRLQDQKLSDVKLEALEALLADGFERNGTIFQKELAAAIFKEQGGRPIVEYSHIRDRMTWKAPFFGQDPERGLLRDSSLLSRAGNQYRFVHRSVLEYFFSCTICDAADNNDADAYTDATPLSIGSHPLSQRSLVEEPSIIQFLAERAQIHRGFKEHLHTLLDLSKSDPRASQAAANAISILVRTGVHFNGADLRGIRIPGADLTGGQFDSAQLLNADLTSVNLTKAWIRQVDFSGALMERVRFGELPRYLVSGSWDGTVRLWNCETGMVDRILEGRSGEVTAVALSSCGKQVASAYRDGSFRRWDTLLRLWDVDTGTCTMILTGVADGRRIVAGDVLGEVGVYDAASLEPERRWKAHVENVTGVGFSSDGQLLVSCGQDCTVKVWDLQTFGLVYTFTGHSNRVTSAVFSLDGSRIASSSHDQTVRLWEVNSIGLNFHSSDSSDPRTSLAYSPDGQFLISGSRGGWLRQYDSETGEIGLAAPTLPGRAECVAYSPDGLFFASGGQGGDLTIRSTQTGEVECIMRGHNGRVLCVAFSPCSRWIASGGSDKTVRIWDARSRLLFRELLGCLTDIISIGFSGDGREVTSGCVDGEIRVWDVEKAEIDDCFGDITGIVWRSSGTALEFATACEDGSIRVWRVVEDDAGKMSVRMVWGSGCVGLAASGIVFTNAIDLSATNRKLLEQHVPMRWRSYWGL
ncbi:WD_REPEATS_REGION domain-containing protein [Linnemannia elongata]|nr:WD_REPEATS_REGION domain-containing protein [Linnemannia elongata]